MQHLLVSDESEIKQIIRYVFSGDVNQRKYFEGETEEASIVDTCEKNIRIIEAHNAQFYKLLDDHEKTVGFINVIPDLNMLFSFGLRYEHRTKENKSSFSSKIDELLPGKEIGCGLYAKNTRGIRFLEQCGFVVQPQNTVTLVKKRKK